MIPQIVSWLIGSIIVGIISSKTGRYVEFPKIGFLVMAAGVGAMATWTAESSWGQVYGIEVLVGFGLALSITMLTLIVQASLDPRDIGPGTTMSTFVRSMGGTISIAVSSAILQSVVQSEYSGRVPSLYSEYGISPQVAGAYMASFSSGAPKPGNLTTEQVAALENATVHSFQRGLQMLFVGLVPFAIVGWLAILLVKHIPLQTKATGFATRKAGDKSGYGKGETTPVEAEDNTEMKAQPHIEMA